jgi:RND family efflux transporter MFP subunit
LLILAAAILITVRLVKSKPAPERKAQVDLGVLVETSPVKWVKERVDVDGLGSVVPAERVVLQPQVTGAVTWVSETLVLGGQVKAGDILLRIDRRDYEIALEERKTAMAQAEAQYKQEEGQQIVAQREWELFRESANAELDPSLALRAPQKRIAEVNIDASKARMRRAQLDLERTVVRAPFNAYVQSESVEVGQIVSPQTQLATLVGTDEFWIQASVPVASLGMIQIPGVNSDGGSPVRIEQQLGEQTLVRDGEVIRLLPDLDSMGRMARVLVRVDDPLRLKDPADGRELPLLMGAQVRVRFDGMKEAEVAVIERSAIYDGDSLHVYNDGRLAITKVNVVRRERDVSWVTGIEEGTLYITSKIPTPVDGLKLRTAQEAK